MSAAAAELAALQRFLDAGSQPRALVLRGGRGHSFGEMALLAEGLRRSATVAALEEAETFAVYLEALYISAERRVLRRLVELSALLSARELGNALRPK